MFPDPHGLDSRYWLLIGDTPSGPFDVQQIHAHLSAGKITWQTPACPVGGSVWLPLIQMPGVGPMPAAAPKPAPVPVTTRAVDCPIWLLVGGIMQGPFTVEQLRDRIASGQLTWDVLACPDGGSQWEPLAQHPAFRVQAPPVPEEAIQAGAPVGLTPVARPAWRPPGHSLPIQLPGSGSPVSPSATKPPWNPITIAWLGLVLSPVWSGIMAALNGRRLRLDLPWWRPISIGVGSLILALLNGAWRDWYLLDLALYLGAVGLIGYLDLLPQQVAYQQFIGQGKPAAGWVFPSLAGSPLVVLVILTFVIAPFIPLEPRQVCEKFANASSEKEMKKYTTNNLWPALATLAKLEDKNTQGDVELTDEGSAPAEVGGYLVGFRVVFLEAGQRVSMDGLFHLVDRQGEWKIEDMYFSSVNRQPLEPWIALSRDYPQLAQVPPTQIQPTSEKSWWADPKNQKTASVAAKEGGKILASKGSQNFFKKAGAVIAVVVVGIGLFIKSLSGGTKERVKTGAGI